MRQVGLLETEFHEHILYYLARIADHSHNHVTIFTTAEFQERVQDELDANQTDIDWVVSRSDESHGAFLKRIRPICEERLDVLVAITIAGAAPRLYQYAKFDPDCPKLLWIYNVRTWLQPKLTVTRSPKEFVDVNSRTLVRRFVLRNFDGLLVQYSPWKEYIERETDYDGPVYAFPRIFYENDSVTERDDVSVQGPTMFTVPGTIIDKRDYELVLDGFESTFHPEDDVELCLLGRPGTPRASEGYGDRVLERCGDLEADGYKITYYRDWIPQDEFSTRLQETDVIISPLQRIPKKRSGYVELHGQTTGTGAIFDALGNGNPLMIPSEYVIGEEIAGLSYQYDSPEAFRRLLESFGTDEEFLLNAKLEAFGEGQRFTLNKQQDRFRAILDDFADEMERA